MNRQLYKQYHDKENGEVSFEIIDDTVIFRQNYYTEARKFDTYDQALSYVDAKMVGLKKNQKSSWKEVSTESSTLLQQAIESLSIQSFEDIITYFDKIIEVQDNFLLLPFLQKIERKYVENFRQHLRKLKKHYMTHVQLREPDPKNKNDYGDWGYRGTWQQKHIIIWAAVAFMDKDGIKSWDEAFEMIAESYIPTYFGLLKWAKPSWLIDYIFSQIQKNEWVYISYSHIRLLEKNNLVTFQPELFVQLLTRFNLSQTERRIGHEKAIDYYKNEIFGDETALKRDLPLIFEYETSLHNCKEWVKTGKKHDEGYVVYIWKEIIEQALQERIFERIYFLENCLSMQSKNWNTNLLQFFRKQFEDNKPSTEELLQLQQSLFALLPMANKNVVNFAISTLKSIVFEKAFQQGDFIEWGQTVMTNSECKTSIKTVLGIYEKYLKAQSPHQERILCNVADVYCVNDLSLQEKATQIILKYASSDDIELASFLQTYQPQMLGNISQSLNTWLEQADTETTTTAEPVTQYEYNPPQKPQLSNYSPIEVPATWNDFMFWIGKVITSENPIDFEVLMNLIASQQIEFPADADAQLKVYRKQIENKIGYTRHYENLFLIQTLYENKRKFEIAKSYDTYRSKNIKIKNNLIAFAFNLYINQQNLCLLSLPTHEPYWIDGSVLLQRIAQYQSKNVLMNTSDLAIAISRALPNPSQNIEPLLASIDPNLANLFRFLWVDTEAEALQRLDIAVNEIQESILNKMMDELSIKPKIGFTHLIEGDGKSLKSLIMKSFWALVARIRFPKHTFTCFEHSSLLKDTPNVVTPLNEIPQVVTLERKNSWQKEPVVWKEIQIKLPEFQRENPVFYYSNDIFKKKENDTHWFSFDKYDVRIYESLMPQYTESVLLTLVHIGHFSNTASATEALTLMLNPSFPVLQYASFFLACTSFVENKVVRALTAEVLIVHIDNSSLDIIQLTQQLSYLINKQWGSIQRLLDVVLVIKDISDKHNVVLHQLIEGLLIDMAQFDEIPKNTKKLMEIWYDILSKTKLKPSPIAIQSFEKWKSNGTLKKLCRILLNNKPLFYR